MSISLETRYGKQKQPKKLPPAFWITLAALAAILSAAFVWWVTTNQSAANPEYKDIAHKVVSQDEVSLTFEVVKDPDTTAVCALKALNANRAPVGWLEYTVGPNDDSQGDSTVRNVTVSFRTLEEATAVTVDSCWNPQK